MAANMILLPSIFTSLLFFSLFSVASQDQQNNNHDLLDHELRDVKLKHSLLESVLEENINAKTHYVKGFEKSLEDRATKTTFLQSALSNLKMAEVVTEQWIQIQHLEQALQIAEMRALQAQRERNMRCTFLKFINDISGRHLPKMFKALDSYSLGKGTIIKSYMSQAPQQLRRFYWTIKKFHHELQGFIKQEMQRNEVAATFVNDELIFVLASAFITLLSSPSLY